MSEQQFYTKAFRDTRFTLYAEGPVEDRRASLSLSFYDGQPRFKVNTGVQGMPGLINFPSNLVDFTGVLAALKEATAPDFQKTTTDSWQTIYTDNKPTKEKKLTSVLHIGKNKEGVIYIAITTETHPKIAFFIKPSSFHIFKDKDGSKIDDGKMSDAMTLMMVDILTQCCAYAMMRRSEENVMPSTQQNAPASDNKQADYKFDDIAF